jgi:hypothetical protein
LAIALSVLLRLTTSELPLWYLQTGVTIGAGTDGDVFSDRPDVYYARHIKKLKGMFLFP